MEVYCKGKARIRHKTTGVIHEIESDELDWDAVGGCERQMGLEIHYEAMVEHPELGELTWSLWEYPLGMENYSETSVDGHELVEDFDYGLEHVPEPDIWGDYTLPDDPFVVFMDSHHHTKGLLADHGSDDGRDLLNRMIFAHQVTALEAYLGDTLMKAVLGPVYIHRIQMKAETMLINPLKHLSVLSYLAATRRNALSLQKKFSTRCRHLYISSS